MWDGRCIPGRRAMGTSLGTPGNMLTLAVDGYTERAKMLRG